MDLFSWRSRLALIALASPFVGCAEGDAASRGTARETVRDSAGITIVENPDVGTGHAEESARWTHSPKPTLTIGDDLGAEGFGRLAGAVRFADGTIGAADALSLTVRRFSASGDELPSVGRRGSGPGEFEAIDRVWLIGGDRLGVWDGRLSRYTVVRSDGEVTPSVSLQRTAIKGRYAPIAFLPDGHLLAQSDARELPSLSYYRPDITLLTFDSEGSVADTVASIPGVEMWDRVWELGTTPLEIPFGRTTSLRVHRDAIYVAANQGYQIDHYDTSGALVRRLRLDRSPRELAATDIESYRDAARARDESSEFSKGPSGFWEGAADAAPYPNIVPYYSGFQIDDRDRMWIQDYRTDNGVPTRYTVFDLTSGRVLGAADFPAPFTATQISDGEVLGIWRDELDIEHVRSYQLIER